MLKNCGTLCDIILKHRILISMRHIEQIKLNWWICLFFFPWSDNAICVSVRILHVHSVRLYDVLQASQSSQAFRGKTTNFLFFFLFIKLSFKSQNQQQHNFFHNQNDSWKKRKTSLVVSQLYYTCMQTAATISQLKYNE